MREGGNPVAFAALQGWWNDPRTLGNGGLALGDVRSLTPDVAKIALPEGEGF
jgi:hypothetical protein